MAPLYLTAYVPSRSLGDKLKCIAGTADFLNIFIKHTRPRGGGDKPPKPPLNPLLEGGLNDGFLLKV